MHYSGYSVRAAVLAAALLFGLAVRAEAATPLAKCDAAIAKGSGKFEQARAKILQKCEASILKGKFAGPCPDAKSAEKLTKAQAKLAEKIAKGCCGDDETCGTLDDVTVPLDLGWGTTCSDAVDGTDCSSVVLTDVGDIADCVVCHAGGNVNGLISLAYDSLAVTTDAALLKCQQEIGSKAVKIFGATSKELTKCRAADLAGGSCPGASDAYLGAKGIAKIDKAGQKAVDSILAKCTGFSAAAIGLPATCPTIVSQGAGDVCTDGAIADVSDYLTCLGCVAQRSIICPECSHCGNGVIDFALGETCDPGDVLDGDSCPSDCKISTCTPDFNGATVNVDVSFTAPEGVAVASLEMFVHYPEEVIFLSGSGLTTVSNVPAGVDVTANDRNYGLNVVALDPSVMPIAPGRLFSASFRLCDGQELSDKALACVVVEAADNTLTVVDGVTCTAKQQ